MSLLNSGAESNPIRHASSGWKTALCFAASLVLPPAILNAQAPTVFHAYNGDTRPMDQLIQVMVASPVYVSFLDESLIRVGDNHILALVPGEHVLIAGCPSNERVAESFAARMAALMSANDDFPVSGKPGDKFLLRRKKNDILEMSITAGGKKTALPEACKAELVPAAGDDAQLFTAAASGKAVKAPATNSFLQTAGNAADRDALQGKWRLTAINMQGKEYTKEEFQRRAAANGGNTKLLDMGLEIRGLRVKWTGSTTGESVIVGMEAGKKPKQLKLVSIANGKDEQYAIYDIQADSLRYCFSSHPPKKFESDTKKAQLSFTLVREAGPGK